MTLDNYLAENPQSSSSGGAGSASFKCSAYQVSTVVDLTTVLLTGTGESGFDSGEGA